MAENSAIEWTDHTFNPWRGCTKVHEGCANCYALDLSKRNPGTLGVWGPNGKRVVAAEDYWKQPLKWEREAAKEGVRKRVFCASLADVFEDWQGPMSDHEGRVYMITEGMNRPRPTAWPEDVGGDTIDGKHRPATMHDVRRRLFALIDATPHLDWLLLTKRPENLQKMWPVSGLLNDFRSNVWLGSSVSLKDHYQQIEELKKCRDLTPVLFLSIEPLLGPMDDLPLDGINWVIAGGESGHNARPMHPDWVRGIRDQCQAAGVPFLMKQWGEWSHEVVPGTSPCLDDLEDNQCVCANDDRTHIRYTRVGKKAAGRLLDGVEHNEFPEAGEEQR